MDKSYVSKFVVNSILFHRQQISVMAIIFLCLVINVVSQENVAFTYTNLVGETLDGGGSLQQVQVASGASGMDTLSFSLVEDPGILTIWQTSGAPQMMMREKFIIPCEQNVNYIVLRMNIAPGLNGRVNFNGKQNNFIHTSFFYTFVYFPDLFRYCEENQISIETSQSGAGGGTDKWIWYSISMQESDFNACHPCTAICGNGMLESSEECDDGNREIDDGCSPACTVEQGWVCSKVRGTKSVCSSPQQFCGNGFREFYLAKEMCDDGNKDDGDGCSGRCQVEEGFVCRGTLPSICSKCGNLVLDQGEECEDGARQNHDGCDSNCLVEPHYQCSGVPSSCHLQPYCGDGTLHHQQSCDDGNENSGDGCSDCEVDPGWECVHQEGPSSCSSICQPNGAVEGAESCDDGNEEAGDGCDECHVEEGWSCTLTEELASICEKDERCGNGRLDPLNLEECDDGNLAVGDGCDEACRIQEHYRCWTLSLQDISRLSTQLKLAQSLCFLCGDRRISFGEECDDGNQDNGDGCSSDCMLEP